MNQKDYFRSGLAVILLAFLSACTLELDLDSMLSGQLNAEKSKIVVPTPAWGVADNATQLLVRVYAKNKEGQPLIGFKPVLGILGEGSHEATCELLKKEYAQCELTASQGGHKLLYLKNGKIDNLGHAYFYESLEKNSMSLQKSKAASNGFDKLKVSLRLEDRHEKSNLLMEPILFSDSGKPISASCNIPSHSGATLCEVKSDLAGAIEIKTGRLNLKTVIGEFVSPKIKFLSKFGQIGPGGTPVQLIVHSVDKPVLDTYPNTDLFVCHSSGKDQWLCSMSSDVEGTKVVRITSTEVNETVEVYFANGQSAIEKKTTSAPRADGEEELELVLNLKKISGEPIKGVLPTVELTGVGYSALRCLESSEEGISTCYLKSIAPGEKTLQVLTPLIKDTVSVTFQKAAAYKIVDEVEADGKSFAIFAVYGSVEGGTPKLDIQGPSEAVVSSYCSAPSQIESADPYRSFCFLTASQQGVYKVNISSLESTSLNFKFVNYGAFLTFPNHEDGEGKADGIENVELVVNTVDREAAVKSSDVELQFSPSKGIAYSCVPGSSSSQIICSVRSSASGIFRVHSSIPLSSNEKILRFLNPQGGLAADDPGSGIVNRPYSVTDPKSFAVIYVELKDQDGSPMIGVVPELLIEGSGHSTSICYPSNSDGIARCEITSDEVGPKIVTVINPLLQETIIINVSSNVRSCTASFATNAIQTWTGPDFNDWGVCTVNNCEENYSLALNSCAPMTRACLPMPEGAQVATQIWDSRNLDKTWGLCTIQGCQSHYTLTPAVPEENNSCVAEKRVCPPEDLSENFHAGIQIWNGNNWGLCEATVCEYPYAVTNKSCSLADTDPAVNGFFVNKVNALPDEEVVSNILSVNGLNRNVPLRLLGGINGRIEMRRSPGGWVSLGRGVDAADLIDTNKGIQNGDEIRLVATASSDLSTDTPMSLTIGSALALDWNITTAAACHIPWGGTLLEGQSITAYQIANPVYPTNCQSQTRTCSAGILSGSYPEQSCNQQYSYSWYESGWGACPLNSWSYSGTGACSASCGSGSAYATYSCVPTNNTRTQAVYCLRNDGTQVADSFCAGAKPATSQSCLQTSCSGSNPSGYQSCSSYSGCSYSWATGSWSTCAVTSGAYCWTGNQTRTATCKRSDGTTVANSYCGTLPATSQTCTATSSCYSGTGSCTEVDHPAGSNTNWYCDSWSFGGDARSGEVCLTGFSTGRILSPKTGLVVHFTCWRN